MTSIVSVVDGQPTTYRELFAYIALLEGTPQFQLAAAYPTFHHSASQIPRRGKSWGGSHSTALTGQA